MKKTIIIIVAILVIAGAAYFYFKPGKGGEILKKLGIKKAAADPVAIGPEDLTVKAPDNGAFVTAAPIIQDKNGFPLMEGSRGEFVKNIQTALNTRFGSDLVVDGILGTKTARAISAQGFQVPVYYKHYYSIIGVK